MESKGMTFVAGIVVGVLIIMALVVSVDTCTGIISDKIESIQGK